MDSDGGGSRAQEPPAAAPAPSGQEQLPGVLQRLRAREQQRSAEASKRAEAAQDVSGPGESVATFLSDFAGKASALNDALARLAADHKDDAAELQEGLQGVEARLVALEQEVAAASYYLPTYELQQLTAGLAGLRAERDGLAAASQPRKFAFKRKPSAAKVSEPAAGQAAAAAVPPQPPPVQQQQLPAASMSGRTLSGLRGQTVCLRREEIAGQDLTLADLEGCTVFVLGPPAALFGHRLRRCRLYCGPVAGGSLLEGLEDCALWLASRQVRVHSAARCDLYLRVLSNPIIEDCDGVRVAPYAFAYPGSDEDLQAQGMLQDSGQWAAVQDFGWLRASPSPHWALLPESDRQVAEPAPPAADGQLPRGKHVAEQPAL